MAQQLEQEKINEIVMTSLEVDKVNPQQTLGELGADRGDFLDMIHNLGINHIDYISGGELNKTGKQKFRELGDYAEKRGLAERKNLFSLIAEQGIGKHYQNIKVSDLKLIQNYGVEIKNL